MPPTQASQEQDKSLWDDSSDEDEDIEGLMHKYSGTDNLIDGSQTDSTLASQYMQDVSVCRRLTLSNLPECSWLTLVVIITDSKTQCDKVSTASSVCQRLTHCCDSSERQRFFLISYFVHVTHNCCK